MDGKFTHSLTCTLIQFLICGTTDLSLKTWIKFIFPLVYLSIFGGLGLMRKFLPEFMDGALNMIQNGVMGKIAFFHPILDKNTLL